MGVICLWTLQSLGGLGDGSLGYGVRVLAGVGIGVVVYGGLAWLFLREELLILLKMRRIETPVTEV